jgi:hypothetical protein
MAFGLWGANGEIPHLLFCESNLVPLSGTGTLLGG